MLFLDNDHSEMGPAPYGEPHFSYLNRSGRSDMTRVRQIAESWFSHYPSEHKHELRRRFQSNDGINFMSSFFELFIHEILFQLGYAITIHPTVPSGASARPDFYAESPNGVGFYLEAVLALSKSEKQLAAESRLDVLYNTINSLHSPNFFIGIKMKGAPKSPPPGRRIRSFLQRQLDALDPDNHSDWITSGGFDALPNWQFSHEGWDVEFFAIPKSAAFRGNTEVRPLSIHMPTEAHFVDSRTPIRDAITQKAGRYGRTNHPFIIAVNALDPFVDDDDAVEALFGAEQVVVSSSGSGFASRMARAPDSAWISKLGPRNTRISAVLICTSIYPWSVAATNTCLYHNPWARQPYSGELEKLRRVKVVGEAIQRMEGIQPRSLFSLPEGWPRDSERRQRTAHKS